MDTVAPPVRCPWARTPLSVDYHDREWGVPLHDDRMLFEFLILEGMQAGLSWETILRKRKSFRRAFARFDPVKVAAFTDDDSRRLLDDPGIVRNRLKIAAAVDNARRFLEVCLAHGSFDAYLWGFTGGSPIVNRRRTMAEIPATTTLSETISRDLRSLGFRFVGPTIIYALLQAVGVVNDHLVDCYRYAELQAPASPSA